MISKKVLVEIGVFDDIYLQAEYAFMDWVNRMVAAGYKSRFINNNYIYTPSFFMEESIQRDSTIYFTRWGKELSKESDKRLSKINDINLLNKIVKYRKYDKLNILCILPTLNPYGGVISVVNLLNELILLGHNCVVISLSKCDNHPHTLYTEPLHVPNWDDIPNCISAEFDVCIATSWETVKPILAVAKKNNCSKVIYFVQDLEDNFYEENDPRRQKARDTYFQIETKVVKTNYLARSMEKYPGTVYKISPGMNLDLFYPRNQKKEVPTVLGMVRYGHYHRGFDLVLKTFELVHEWKPYVKFTLFGSDKLPELDVKFPYVNLGRVKPEQLPEIYSQADIFLEMSRHHGFGRTGVEAMACGTACVLSDSGGISEYVEDGKNALVVPVGDIHKAAESICYLLDNYTKRMELVREGLNTVKRMSDRQVAREFLAVIQSLR
jgi:glycosyltransferase involved in cell wall biosynthesis